MIEQQKLSTALYSLHTILVLARAMAYDGRPGKEIADVLDLAEHMPRLLVDDLDRTNEFRECLVELSGKHAGFELALERFDRGAPKRW